MNLEVAVSQSMSRHADCHCEKVKKGNDAYQLKKCMTVSFSTLASEIYVVFNIETGGRGSPDIVDPGIEHEPRRFFNAF